MFSSLASIIGACAPLPLAKAIDVWLEQHGGLGGITAIFCAADNLALGVMTALDRAGVKMPEDKNPAARVDRPA